MNHFSPNCHLTLNHESDLQHQAYQHLLLGQYKEAVGLYEQAIAREPNTKSNYWYLGLLLLLQGQETEAQTTWFLGMAEGEPEKLDLWTTELIEVLRTEAERIEKSAVQNYQIYQLIREHIKELNPTPEPNVVKYSYLDEESVIDHYLTQLNLENEYCVDIAASDGVTMSNTYFLFKRGWSGLAVEFDSTKFAILAHNYSAFFKANLSKCIVTPENVNDLLKSHQVPEKFGLLNLDIDGYDYFVLEQILNSYRPSIICTEINESIPPPLKFTVKWNPNYSWAVNRFFGQSISQLDVLCKKYNYALVKLHYNNAFLIPQEISPTPSLLPEEAFKQGYLDRPDRQKKFPWNVEIEEIYSLPNQEALNYVNQMFAEYKGQFSCYI